MIESPLLTAKDVAKILKVSKALAYRLFSDDQLPAVRFGRTVRVKPEDLEEFIQRNTVGNKGGKNEDNIS